MAEAKKRGRPLGVKDDGRLKKKKGVKSAVRRKTDLRPNQWTGTVQQEKFLALYLDPTSPNFGNPYAAALEAGYEESYAKIIATPSVGRLWIKEARDLVNLGPEHITQKLQQFALDDANKTADQIHALEVIAKMQGLFVEKKLVGHYNIESALEDLK